MYARVRPVLARVLLFLTLTAVAAAQGTYYNSISTASSSFVSDLKTRIRSPYTHVAYSQFDETNVANFASRDTTGGQRTVTCVYSGQNYVYTPPFAWTTFSREHTWCHSWMPTNPADSPERDEYSDQHHLFPTNQNNANGVRSNHPLGIVATVSSQFLEGKLGTNANGETVYEPRDSHKGDAARALLYMSVRYDGIDGYDWTFNTLNTVTLPGQPQPEAPQDLATLLQWHRQDPPTKREVERNDYIQGIQGNRNPFTDHPEYVPYIDFSSLTKLSPTYAAEPSNQPTGLAFSGITSSSFTVSWTAASAGSQSPSGYLVEVFPSDDYFIPIDGSAYADDVDLTDGRGVVNTGATSHTFTGLPAGSTYHVRVQSYNGSGSSINYKTDGVIPSASGATIGGTLADEPTNYPAGYGDPVITSTSITVTWSDASGAVPPTGYLLMANTGGTFTDPSDGTTYADDTALGDGSARVNVAQGTQSCTFTGLTPSTNYTFKLYPYNGDGGARNYKTASFPGTLILQYTTGASGSSQPAVVVNEYANGSSQSTEWVELLTLTGNTDMRGMILRDYSSSGSVQTSPLVFSDHSLWSSVPIGAFIVVLAATNTQTEDLSFAGDKLVVVSAGNAAYFSGNSFSIAGSADAVELLTAGATHVHSLSHGSKPGSIAALPAPTANASGSSSSGNVVRFVSVSSADDFALDAKAAHGTSATQGAANDAAQQTYVSTSLPVELVSFTARAAGRGVELRWTTATESDNDGFEVQRRGTDDRFNGPSDQSPDESTDRWSRIAFVPGHGTTNTPHAYSYVDRSASGTVQYRLKQTDRDGSFAFSGTVEFTAPVPVSFSLAQNSPNPFNPSTRIRFTLPEAAQSVLTVHNALGQQVAVLAQGMLAAGRHTVPFDASHLAGGIYFARLSSGTRTAVIKMTLLK